MKFLALLRAPGSLPAHAAQMPAIDDRRQHVVIGKDGDLPDPRQPHNPNNGQFTLEGNTQSNGNYTISITDVLGRSIYSTLIAPQNNHINLVINQNLAHGIYIVQLLGEGENVVQRFEIE